MGYAVDEMVSWPSGYVSGVVDHHDQWRWECPFQHYAELLQMSDELHAVAQAHLKHWLRALDQVDDGATALVISSGGSIEPMLVAAFSDGRYAEWGTALHHLEGATLSFDGDECISVQIQRQPTP